MLTIPTAEDIPAIRSVLRFGHELPLVPGVTVYGGSDAGCYLFGGRVHWFGMLHVEPNAVPDAQVITEVPDSHLPHPADRGAAWSGIQFGVKTIAYSSERSFYFDGGDWDPTKQAYIGLHSLSYLAPDAI